MDSLHIHSKELRRRKLSAKQKQADQQRQDTRHATHSIGIFTLRGLVARLDQAWLHPDPSPAGCLQCYRLTLIMVVSMPQGRLKQLVRVWRQEKSDAVQATCCSAALQPRLTTMLQELEIKLLRTSLLTDARSTSTLASARILRNLLNRLVYASVSVRLHAWRSDASHVARASHVVRVYAEQQKSSAMRHLRSALLGNAKSRQWASINRWRANMICAREDAQESRLEWMENDMMNQEMDRCAAVTCVLSPRLICLHTPGLYCAMRSENEC